VSIFSIGRIFRLILPQKAFEYLAKVYRAFFFSVNDFLLLVIEPIYNKSNVLDVGGGDGAVAVQMALLKDIKSIDIVDPNPDSGTFLSAKSEKIRLFAGKHLNQLKDTKESKYDLVLLSDVIHHVPLEFRKDLIKDCLGFLTEAGTLVIKEIEPSGLRSKMAFFADVYISRDPVVQFIKRRDLESLILKIKADVEIEHVNSYWSSDSPNYALKITQIGELPES
jgi:2-polyprenyl-3-methyl-5-hydroxy-6-metoxy-1,4-benzoquinol methylase